MHAKDCGFESCHINPLTIVEQYHYNLLSVFTRYEVKDSCEPHLIRVARDNLANRHQYSALDCPLTLLLHQLPYKAPYPSCLKVTVFKLIKSNMHHYPGLFNEYSDHQVHDSLSTLYSHVNSGKKN